jgi:hypothetical protein
MITPTIHLNGTSRASLLEGYHNAYNAIEAAIDAVAKTAPHGRDYYVKDNNAIIIATNEHRNRLRNLENIRKEIETICLAIMD